MPATHRRLLILLAPMLFALSLLFTTASPATAEGLSPLGVEDGALLDQNSGEFRIGFAYSSDLHLAFQDGNRHRRVFEIPALRLAVGLGKRVEGQLSYSFLRIQQNSQDTAWGSGDLLIAFKVRLLSSSETRPALALRFATKLPDADEKKSFGTDEADIFSDLLLSHRFGRTSIHLNLGLAILSDPGKMTDGQDDLLKYALGLRIPLGGDGGAFLASVEGLDFGEKLNERGAFLAGFQVPAGSWLWDIGGSLGYAQRSEDWSIRSGLTLPFTYPDGL